MQLDYSKLLEAAGGDEELVKELIGIFREDCPKLLAGMEEAIRDSQPPQLREAAHTLKGPLGNMGAYDALDQVVALETMAVNEDLQQADIALERLKNLLEELAQELKTHEKVSVK